MDTKQAKSSSKKNIKPPVIKQTKTSMIRLLKANPLLHQEMDGNTPASIKTAVKNSQSLNSLSTIRSATANKIVRTVSNVATFKKPTAPARTQSLKTKSSSVTTLPKPNSVAGCKPKPQNSKQTSTVVTTNRASRPKQRQDKNTPPRRSLSAQFYDEKSCATNSNKGVQQTQSNEDISDPTRDDTPKPLKPKAVTFKTPNAVRRSVAFLSETKRSLPYTSTPGPAPHDLRRRLSNWLQQRGRPLNSYHHLKCFGVKDKPVPSVQDEENKENVEGEVDIRSGSYEDLRIPEVVEPKTCADSEELEKIVQDALGDLQKLILEGYPLEQCEAWLGLVRNKYRRIEDKPQYWECLAALEEGKGNISSAVEYYRTAIVQGAEVNAVDESLENLLKKFSLLNISAKEVEERAEQKKRNKILKDARNVFKSSIIQFAIQERALKKNKKGKESFVTPVRRSTRESRTGYVKTPDVTLYASFKDADDGSVQFRNNSCLAVKYQN